MPLTKIISPSRVIPETTAYWAIVAHHLKQQHKSIAY